MKTRHRNMQRAKAWENASEKRENDFTFTSDWLTE